MAKTVLKVTVLECGRKVKDRAEKIYEIDFSFSNLQEASIGKQHFLPGAEFRAQVLFNNKVELL